MKPLDSPIFIRDKDGETVYDYDAESLVYLFNRFFKGGRWTFYISANRFHRPYDPYMT